MKNFTIFCDKTVETVEPQLNKKLKHKERQTIYKTLE